MSSKSNTPRFEITEVKFVERDRSPRNGSKFGNPRIYVWVKDETVLENFFERRSRPYLVWKRQIVPQVLPLLRAHIERSGSSSYAWAGNGPKVRWSQKAGCSCGCSPAFIVEATHDHDVHVDVAVMDSVPVQQWGQAVEKVRAEIEAERAETEAAKAAKADPKLTDNEREVLSAFRDDQYLAGDLNGATYSWSILDACPSIGRQSGAGVVASLVKKGLVTSDDYDGDDTIQLTAAGRTVVENLASSCSSCGVGWDDLDGTGEVAVRSSTDSSLCTDCERKAAKADDYSPDTSEMFDADEVVVQAKHLEQQRELESRELISVTDVQPGSVLYQSLRGEAVGKVTSVEQHSGCPRTVRVHLDTGGFLSFTTHALVAVSPSQTPLERALEIVNELDRDEVTEPCQRCNGWDESCESCGGKGEVVTIAAVETADESETVNDKIVKLFKALDQRGAPRTSNTEKQRLIARHGTAALNAKLEEAGHQTFPANASASDVAAYFLTAESLTDTADELAATAPSASTEDFSAADRRRREIAEQLHADNRPVALTLFSGGSFDYRTADGTDHRADLALYLIRLAWVRGVDFESEADGFGAGQGTKGDWSAIRDSSAPARAAMLLKALTSLNLY